MKKWLFPLHSPMQSSFICSSGKAPKCVAMLCDGHESWPSKWVACAAVYSVNICMYVKYKVYILCIGEIKWPTIFELCVIAVWSSLLFSKECILDILLLPCNTHMLYKKKKKQYLETNYRKCLSLLGELLALQHSQIKIDPQSIPYTTCI